MTETTSYPGEPAMSYSDQAPPSSSNSSSMKSGSQYALAALGLGFVVLGVIMTMWNRVLSGPDRNGSWSSVSSTGSSWSVAVVLLCTGVGFLLLSLLLGIRKRQRAHGGQHSRMHSEPGQEGERQAEETERYAVPSYEEVIASDQYTIRQLSAQNHSTTDLPAYEELMEATDGGVEASDPVPLQGADDSYPAGPSRKNGHPGLQPLPLRERRIKSEMDRTISSSSPHIAVPSIEPITPPPQYDDNPPELPHLPGIH